MSAFLCEAAGVVFSGVAATADAAVSLRFETDAGAPRGPSAGVSCASDILPIDFTSFCDAWPSLGSFLFSDYVGYEVCVM